MHPDNQPLLHALLPLVAVTPRMFGFILGMQILPQAIFPATVRNAVALSLSLMAYPLAAADPALRSADPLLLAAFLAKEALVGLVLGYLLGLPLALFESFGVLVDTQSGTNSAPTYDPFAGHEMGALGSLLRQFGVTLIASTGILFAAVEIVLRSYAVWPISLLLPPALYESAPRVLPIIDQFMVKVVLLAFPVVFVLLALELALGRISRSVPQLNVFTVSMPLKALAGVFVLILELLFLLDDIVALLRFPMAPVRMWLGL